MNINSLVKSWRFRSVVYTKQFNGERFVYCFGIYESPFRANSAQFSALCHYSIKPVQSNNVAYI